MKRKTATDILNKKEVILQNDKKVEADGGNMERIKKICRPLHDEVSAIFAYPLPLSK